MTSSPALVVDSVSVSFGSLRAVDGVSLACRAGEVYALVGENGAGKTTLMNVIAGVVRPTNGSVTVAGKGLPVGDARAALRAGVGMVRQHHTLIPSRTVAENIRAVSATRIRYSFGSSSSPWKLPSSRMWAKTRFPWPLPT